MKTFLRILIIAMAVLAQAHAQVPFTNSLVAYYPFSGNGADATSNGNNGTLFGSATFGVDRFGNINSCLSLPGGAGIGSGVDIPSLDSTPYLGITYSAWFLISNYPPASSFAVMTLVGREQCGQQSDGAILLIDNSSANESNDLIYFTGGNGFSDTVVPPTNKWCQVVLTVASNGTINYYFNGTNEPGSGSASAGVTEDFRIGASGGSGCSYEYVWNGLIDDVRIYNRILASNEVQQLYAYESAPIGTSLYLAAQPQNQSVTVGQSATFSVAAGGTPPFGYQWSFDGSNIAGATDSTLTVTNVQMSEAGSYSVMVTNNLTNAINSSNAVLTVNLPPQVPFTNSLVAYYPFSGNGADATSNGNNGTLFGTAGFGVDRFGNANSCLALPGGAGIGSGVDIPSLDSTPYLGITYSAWFLISNYPPASSLTAMTLVGREQCGQQSDGAILLIDNSSLNENNDLLYFSGGGGFTVSVVPPTNKWCQVVLTVASNGTVNYYFNGTNEPGSGSASAGVTEDFRIGASGGSGCSYEYVWNGLIDDVRIYNRVLASNEVQQLYAYESAPIGTSLYLAAQPQNQSVTVGQSATFSVAAGGTPPFGYQWSFDGSNIAGATDSTLTVTNVQMSEAGSYSVMVTNNLTNSINSSNAVLTVNLPPQVPFTNSLVAYYPFSGNASDATGNGNNGQIVGNVVLSTDRFGNVASAYAFDGVSSSAIEVTNTLFNIGQAGYTVSGWLACSNVSLSTYQDIIQTMPQAGMGMGFVPGLPPGALQFGVGTTSSWTETGIYGSSLCSNQVWYQFVLTKSGTTYTLYVDGQVSVQQTISAASGYNANVGCIIGSITPINPSYHQTFGGRLDDFRFYNRALASNEVQQLYYYESTPNGTSLYITSQPQNQSVVVGQSATFGVAVGGTPPFGYQWSFDGTNIAEATNATLTVTNIQLNEAGSYSVTVTNLTNAINSSNAMLTVNLPPQVPFTNSLMAYYPFSGNGADASSNGNNGTLFGRAAFGVDRFGNANSCLSLPGGAGIGSGVDIPSLDSAPYLGTTYSAWFLLSNYPPASSFSVMTLVGREQCGQQSDGAIVLNDNTTLHESNDLIYFSGASGFNAGVVPPTNRWCQVVMTVASNSTINYYFNGTNEPGSGSASAGVTEDFRIGASGGSGCSYEYVWNGLIDDVRIYNRVLASNEVQQLYYYESAPSGTSLYITSQPQNQSVVVGQSATFGVALGGTPPFGYQWSFDGTNVADATNATLTVTNVQLNEAGSYSVMVTNLTNVANSSNALLTLLSPPVITSSPTNQSAVVGTPVTFTASANGTAPLVYQWRFDGTNISGATNTSFSLTNAVLANAGSYCMVATNPYGSATSSVAVLSVAESTVQVVSTSGTGGGTIVVSIDLIALGTESGVGCSLDFDPTVLTYTGVVLGSGASGGVLLSNAIQIPSGHLGLGMDIFGGTFAAGTNDVFDVSFQIAPVTNQTTTTLSFGIQPTGEEISDAQANPLPAVYLPGTVVIAATTLEGDVSPRTNGNDALNISDWVQEGRFVAGLDTISNIGEFQRADCAPRGTLGDGQITVADWVQVGRYAVGLDPLTVTGGPTGPGGGQIKPIKLDLPHPIALVPLSQGTMTNSVAVQLMARGNESALSFSVAFDPALARFVNATLGSGATNAALIQNTNQVTNGSLGLVVGLIPPATFAAGTQQLVKLNFGSVGYSNNAALSFGSNPVMTQLVDSNAAVLTPNFQNGTLAIGGSAWPNLAISQLGSNAVLSWPSAAGFLALQTSSSLNTAWSNVLASPATIGNSLVLTSSLYSNSVFFRLKH